MSEQVYISDEAFKYLKDIQAKIYSETKSKVSMNELVTKAILNNVKEDSK